LILIALISTSFVFAQTNRVKITVTWPSTATQNEVKVYDQANNELLTISSLDSNVFVATYDLGCLAVENPTLPKYYIKVYDENNNGWSSGSSVEVFVADQSELVSNGPLSGQSGVATLNFDVNSSTLCDFSDTDLDGVIDLIDIDDDNDGILDTAEGLDLDQFNCQIPALVFLSGTDDSSDPTPEIGVAGQEGAVYRFTNATEGYDVLVEIIKLDNATLVDLDDDTDDGDTSVPTSLQTRIQFNSGSDAETEPGITFRFTIVDNDPDDPTDDTNTVPTQTLFSIGGTTWDCDGTDVYQESVRYYNPSAYGLDNPTSLTQDDYPDGAGITAGTVSYDDFDTNPILRSYFQFKLDATDEIETNDYFEIKMQLKRDNGNITPERYYAMSFTQCDIFDYKAPSLIIVSGEDTDGDGINNELDIDADGDGIPDNVEAQSTLGYTQPNDTVDFATGLDTAYTDGINLIDTDGDNIPDFLDTDSDNDGTPDIEENGMANTALGVDTDGDGLDDAFEGVNLDDPLDVNDDIDDPANSVLPDSDDDLGTFGGDLDYRDASNFGSATIDFDGIDDYLDSSQILDGKSAATIMAWIKLDDEFNSNGFVAGQENFNMFVSNTRVLNIRLNGATYPISNSLDLNKWVHVAAVYGNGSLVIYINGERESSAPLSGSLSSNGDKFTIGKNQTTDSEFFKGSIDEVRVLDGALTDDQLQQIVFQEIDQNTNTPGEPLSGVVKGKVVPRDISDFTSGITIPWSKLEAYYPMNIITGGVTFNESGYPDRDATLHNINSIQEQTSPIPYETKSSGAWSDVGIWKNGDVWDITDPTIKDWAIFRINENDEVYHDASIKSYGLLVDAGAKLTIGLEDQDFQDFQLQNGWYLKLDGTIDLQDDSQLVQTENSELVTGLDGKLLRRQEGNLNFYWYNYWSSPVGIQAVTSNTNTDFNIGMIKDGGGISGFNFTNAYEAEGLISRYWLYTFQNGQTYYNWQQITELSEFAPGIGYTQKGIHSSSDPADEQQYTFVGKPNNGTILIDADDVDGDSSDEHLQDEINGIYNYTSSLIGNPYPSALDGPEFIRDNEGVIEGTIYLWEQWSGASHYLAEYEGGYGTINIGSVAPAYQWNNPDLDVSDLVKTPSQFIPVAQGFFVEVVEDGNIEFNNSQRVFKKETDPDGPIFFRSSNTENQSSSNEDNAMGIIRLQLTVSNGNKRNFVLGFSDQTTEGYDYGYDSRTIDPQDDDMNSYLNDEKMVIQSYSPITEDKVVDLVFNSTGTYNYSFEILELKNIPEDQNIIVRDNLTNTEFDLRTGAYNFTSDVSGEDRDRFDIVFKATTLGTNDFSTDNTLIFVNNNEHKLYVKGLSTQANKLSLTNMLGQNIRNYGNLSSQTLDNGLDVSNLSSGVYIVSLTNDSNQTIDKKVIIE